MSPEQLSVCFGGGPGQTPWSVPRWPSTPVGLLEIRAPRHRAQRSRFRRAAGGVRVLQERERHGIAEIEEAALCLALSHVLGTMAVDQPAKFVQESILRRYVAPFTKREVVLPETDAANAQ